jgi:hypothetical protein
MSTTLSFDPGNVDVTGSDFSLWQQTFLSWSPGNIATTSFGLGLSFVDNTNGATDIKVSGGNIRFRRIRRFTLAAGTMDVIALGMRFTPRRRTTFTPLAEVLVSSPGFVMRPALVKLRFAPGEILVTGQEFSLVRLVPRLLPEIRPTGREFTPPSYAFTRGFTEARIEFKRLLASRRGSARLRLIWDNLDDSEVESFLQLWDDIRGGELPVRIPEVTLDSVGGPLRAYMESPEVENEWTITQPPTVAMKQTGVSDLKIELASRHNPRLGQLSPLALVSCVSDEDESGPVVCDVPPQLDCVVFVDPNSSGELLGSNGLQYPRIGVDSNNNTYVAVFWANSLLPAGFKTLLIKYAANGNFLWQKAFGIDGINVNPQNIAVLPNGDFYVAGNHNTMDNISSALLAKYSSNGDLIWQRRLAPSANCFSVTVGENQNVYCTGDNNVVGVGNRVLIFKYNSSGDFLWQRALGSTATSSVPRIEANGQGDIYLAIETSSFNPDGVVTGAGGSLFVAKLNTAGDVIWSNSLWGSIAIVGFIRAGKPLAIGPQGQVFILARHSDPDGRSQLSLTHYTVGGDVAWIKMLAGPPNDRTLTGGGVAVSADGFIYITGSLGNAQIGAQGAVIAKYSMSGTLLWQRMLSSEQSIFVDSIAVGPDNQPRIACSTNNSDVNGFFVQYSLFGVLTTRLPSDGSGLGTHGPFSYSNPALRDLDKEGFVFQPAFLNEFSLDTTLDSSATLSPISVNLPREGWSVPPSGWIRTLLRQITPPPPPPPPDPANVFVTIQASDADKSEGNTGTKGFLFTVSRNLTSSEPCSVSYAVTGSGANPASPSDFSGGVYPSGTATISGNFIATNISIPVEGDLTIEEDEQFTVTISNPVNCTIGSPSSAVGIIRNDDFTEAVLPEAIAGTYSQRSVDEYLQPATLLKMANGNVRETFHTATDYHGDTTEGAWLQVDFGAPTSFSSVVVGADSYFEMWGYYYTEDADIIGSNDGASWTVLANVGRPWNDLWNDPNVEYDSEGWPIGNGVREYATPGASYRYLRLRSTLDNTKWWFGYLVVTEFYAKL